MTRGFLEVWQYRGFIFSSIVSEFKIKFSRSKLGAFWMILQPLSQVVIYALILSTVMGARLPQVNNRYAYALYLLSGTLAWTYFNEIVTRCLTLFVEKANLLKKMQFPRITLLLIVIGSALFNQLMLFLAIIFIFMFLGYFSLQIFVWLPVVMLANTLLATGIGLILGVLNVFMRDLTHMVPILMQLLFWATPIVYPLSIIPEHLRYLLQFNPLCSVVQSYQNLFLYHQMPAMNQVLAMGILSLLVLMFGIFIFRRASPEMADVL